MADDLTFREYTPEELSEAFIKLYGGSADDVRLYSSPARINIIGEHIDYNGGKVFPAAINRYLYIAIRKRDDSKILYNDMRFPGSYQFDIKQNFVYDKTNDYANYLNGIIQQLKERGF
ncbi:MAG: galactokinase, partial [Treponema sp.]|nr:galactokinase [Treponema sp.]